MNETQNKSSVKQQEAGLVQQGNVPARFALVHQSKDGSLSLFQDANGHLTAVATARLA